MSTRTASGVVLLQTALLWWAIFFQRKPCPHNCQWGIALEAGLFNQFEKKKTTYLSGHTTQNKILKTLRWYSVWNQIEVLPNTFPPGEKLISLKNLAHLSHITGQPVSFHRTWLCQLLALKSGVFTLFMLYIGGLKGQVCGCPRAMLEGSHSSGPWKLGVLNCNKTVPFLPNTFQQASLSWEQCLV